MKSNNSTSLATLTLLVLALIISILYVQISADNVVDSKPINRVQVLPVDTNNDSTKLSVKKASTNTTKPSVKKETPEQQPEKPQWQPSLTMAHDVKKSANSVVIENVNNEHSNQQLIKATTAKTSIFHDDLQFNPYIGLEADYANLSSSQVGQEAIEAKDAPEVEYRKADDAAAVLLNIVGSFYFDKNSSLYAKLGVNAWQVDDNHLNAMSSSNIQAAPNMNSKSNIGADMFYGIGFKYDWRSFVFKSEYKVINLNGEQFQTVNIGGEINF